MAESASPKRLWLIVTATGCVLVVLAMIVVTLVLVDKPHFGELVGKYFAEVMSAGMMVGSAIVLLGVWNLPNRTSWRSLTLMAWGLIGLTSPVFGFLFLLPWGVLALMLPLVVVILRSLFRLAPAPLASH
ncbi:MAG TPA: hypothetical protein VFN10_17565 [Thermoanaerobaculia bacterium]|nr:hypothetical protein [Thermoanaerobaculia bacterium]